MKSAPFLLRAVLFAAMISTGCCTWAAEPQAQPRKELIEKDDFDGDLSQWVVEQGPGGTVHLDQGALDIDDAKGCTVWFKKKFSGPVCIEYEATMIQAGGANDRVSDLNCFWMATDPKYPEDIFVQSQSRGGSFKKYDFLRLYYVGYGANENLTTRFRRYPGDGSRPLLSDQDLREPKFMNVPNQKVKIQLVADGSQVQFFRDGELIFNFQDPNPLLEGWFAFRTVRNHMKLEHFRVYRLVH
jgi:hypothetical protein